ncbi:MAG: DUF47 family protein [Magnetococcales bacterium]|nr:DUF47 family protein [Magnetococcales bacterium]
MSGNAKTLTERILENIFPTVPDFYGMLVEHSEVCVQSMNALVAFMETHDAQQGNLVRELEKKGDEIKARNMAVLNQAFATPLDREDIYRAVVAVDQIINYAKTTVRELEVLELAPDAYTLEMAQIMRDGVIALNAGFKKLATTPLAATDDAMAAKKAERTTEKCYRKALATLFHADEAFMNELDANPVEAAPKAMMQVMEMFKRREVYRHMSNCADQLAKAGAVLQDIVVQIS